MPTIGKNSPTAPAGMISPPQRPAQHVVVPQDRQQRPQCGRGQRQRHRDEGVHEAGGREHAGDRDRDHGADQPAGHGQSPAPLPEVVQLELVAGEQEQETQADVGDQLDRVRLRQPGNLGTDQHSADDQHHHLGDPEAGQRAQTNGAAAETMDTTSSARRPVSIHRAPQPLVDVIALNAWSSGLPPHHRSTQAAGLRERSRRWPFHGSIPIRVGRAGPRCRLPASVRGRARSVTPAAVRSRGPTPRVNPWPGRRMRRQGVG